MARRTNRSSGHELKGAQILFVKTLVTGARESVRDAVWGEPMLLSGAPPGRPSIVLVSIDTLRADHVGAYGYEKARTPTLDALARGAVWYANAYSASTWTYPSHAALLRGIYPSHLPPLERKDKGGLTAAQIREAMPTSIAQVLAAAGYRTAAFTGGGYVSSLWLFANGFDSYYAFQRPSTARCSPDRFDGPEVFRRAGHRLRNNGHFPFFLFVHTYDAHDRCEVWPANLRPADSWPDPGPEVIESFPNTTASLRRRTPFSPP